MRQVLANTIQLMIDLLNWFVHSTVSCVTNFGTRGVRWINVVVRIAQDAEAAVAIKSFQAKVSQFKLQCTSIQSWYFRVMAMLNALPAFLRDDDALTRVSSKGATGTLPTFYHTTTRRTKSHFPISIIYIMAPQTQAPSIRQINMQTQM